MKVIFATLAAFSVLGPCAEPRRLWGNDLEAEEKKVRPGTQKWYCEPAPPRCLLHAARRHAH